MRNDSSSGLWAQLPHYVICYGLWIAFSGLGIWIMLRLRLNLLDLVVFLRLGGWVMGAVDKFGILLLGLFWLAFTLFMEYYLRQGVQRNLLWRRAGRILAVEAAMLGVSYGLQILLRR